MISGITRMHSTCMTHLSLPTSDCECFMATSTCRDLKSNADKSPLSHLRSLPPAEPSLWNPHYPKSLLGPEKFYCSASGKYDYNLNRHDCF